LFSLIQLYIFNKARSLTELKKSEKTSNEKLYSLLDNQEERYIYTYNPLYQICSPKLRYLDDRQYYVLNDVLANHCHFKIYHDYAIEKTRREINTSHCIVFIHVDALCPKYTCSQIDIKRCLFTFI
jgi:hypothetical protein